jgi:hypothetical protein
MLQRVDAEQLDRAVCAWLAVSITSEPQSGRVIAVDGKSARGACSRTGQTETGRCTCSPRSTPPAAQSWAERGRRKDQRDKRFAPLLDRVDIAGAIVTADALHTQRAHVTYLSGRGAQWPFLERNRQAPPGREGYYASGR